MSGRVILVGAGPGDPDLLTVRAVRELGRAEVLLYDALIAPAILEHASPDCERIDVGKRGDGTRGAPQDGIAALMIEKARAGHLVVRLKGGDPFVFGRGGEEATALVEAGVPFEVVPGITSAFSVPAYAGIPVTDRRLSSSVAIVTGHRARDREVNQADWEGLARSAETLIVLMGTSWIEEIVTRVIAGGRAADTPSAVIASGATSAQQVVTAPLEELPARVREAGLAAPTVIVIGEVARFRESLAWYERRPLFGKRVLVLRAEEQRADLVARLARAGAEAVTVPLMRFEACGDTEPLPAAAYDWIVFASANAARFAGARVLAAAASAKVACIGAATAEAARSAGFTVELTPGGRALPEALAEALAERLDLRGARVLLPRAAAARDVLRDELERRGARVDPVVVYRNVVPPEAKPRVREVIAAGVDAVTLTSPSSVERLCAVLSEAELAALPRRAALVCIGPTTGDALRRAGVEPTLVARRQSSEGLIEALEAHYSEETNALPR